MTLFFCFRNVSMEIAYFCLAITNNYLSVILYSEITFMNMLGYISRTVVQFYKAITVNYLYFMLRMIQHYPKYPLFISLFTFVFIYLFMLDLFQSFIRRFGIYSLNDLCSQIQPLSKKQINEHCYCYLYIISSFQYLWIFK